MRRDGGGRRGAVLRRRPGPDAQRHPGRSGRTAARGRPPHRRADGCTSIAGAAVDLWHCDSLGFYSHYTAYDPNVWPSGRASPSDNETFLRGRQVSDEAGMVRFQTIYPGWYTPRVQHIHARIVLDQKVAATVQLYFPEKLNRAVALRKPYNQRPPSPYNNLNDFVISQSKGGDGSWLKMTETDGGYRGSLTVGVRV